TGLIADVTGVTPSQFEEELMALTSTYPEQSPNQKYVHFHLAERGANWLFEGEDRNRAWLWSSSPFYSQPFFRLAVSCPDELKYGHDLYATFLKNLSPELADLADVNRGMAATDPRYRRKLTRIARLNRFPRLLRHLQRVLIPQVPVDRGSPTLAALQRHMVSNRAVAEYIAPRAVASLIDHRGRHGRQVFENLLTLTSLITKISGDDASIQ
ncbi:MAG: hypothetical protein KKA42_13035, partial [candidate division Zixibacteria bacterium]|nr:hypothetical protein [candidate division Zixibacteria bacterium]